jgi:D-lactate dehydrogenase (cytochrome)
LNTTQHGLFLAVDPGPGASVGGMVGTGCSGTLCIRHGNMQHHVVSMTVVRPDGRVVTTGRRPRKSSAGYHLAQLMVGSEGTLGYLLFFSGCIQSDFKFKNGVCSIVTEITVRLTPIPESTAVILSPFKALNDATKATLSLLRAGISLSCVELCDDVMVRGMNNYSNLGIDNSPTLFIKVTGHTAQVQADLNRAQEVLRKHEAITKNIKIASNEADIEAIWHARKVYTWLSNSNHKFL